MYLFLSKLWANQIKTTLMLLRDVSALLLNKTLLHYINAPLAT